MKEIVCTIITKDYGHYALAIHDSLVTYNANIHFGVFVSNGSLPNEIEQKLQSRKNVIICYDNFFNDELSQALKEKYIITNHDAYRWGMKPLFLKVLLHQGYDRAFYIDSDIYFFNDYSFLFEELKKYKILLSPHWRSSFPGIDDYNFKLNFLEGIYNGGFVGASQGGQEALTYWAELCLFNCEVDYANGFYVDQKYLDLLPTRFEDVGHIKHKGCNVANWNIVDCQRVLQEDQNVLINNTEKIVFIHFTNSLFKGIYLWKNDTLLEPYAKRYCDELLKYSDVNIIDKFFEKGKYIAARKENKTEASTEKPFFVKLIKKIKRL